MLSGYEEDVSSIRDGYTAWVKVDPAATLERHLVSSDSANPIFREAQDRRHSSPNPVYRFHNDVPNRLREQTRLSILSWNLGPSKTTSRGKRHIIALQKAIEYLQHDYLSSLFHVTHSPDALFFSTKTPSILTLRSAPFTSTIPGMCNIRLSTKDSQDGFHRPSSPALHSKDYRATVNPFLP